MSLQALVLIYILGGITFIPLLVLSFLTFSYFTLPRVSPTPHTKPSDASAKGAADSDSDSSKDDNPFDDEDAGAGSGNEAAGYFAVCREYVPGGINGKPPERASPAGEVLNSESPSVYQSMYRSIFERNKTQVPSVEGDKKDAKTVKRPRNVFFVVLRHRHLLLFDNAEQLEVRHVVSLLHHDVDIYGGGEKLAEGDMWIKKNCIRLTRRTLAGHPGPTSQPFYIFSDNCSDKEDFYHALLLAQFNARDNDGPPVPKPINTDHIIKLVQALHRSDADAHCRWINALMGRIFLAIYKTEEIEDAIKAKIDRKISRVPKPNFISSIQVQNVQMGDTAPVFSNPRLKELMVDGSLTIEMDVKYNGGFRLQIAAIARIELGSRIRAREVDLVLAGVLRKMSGHLLIRIKPPPSNRLWFTFETPPQMDFAVEPVVSSMQITYSVILRAIESRIKEVIGETLVLPNWDDMPFFDTTKQPVRGGIWDVPRKEPKDAPTDDTASEVVSNAAKDARSPKAEASETSNTSDDDVDNLPPISSKALSMPSLITSPTKEVSSRKPKRKPVSIAESQGVSSGVSTGSTPVASPTKPRPTSPRVSPADKPKAMRSNSFASAAKPLVSVEDASPIAHRSPSVKGKRQRDAVELFKEVKSRSDSMPAMKAASEQADKSVVDNDGSDIGSRRSSRESTSREADEPDSAPKTTKPTPSATLPVPESGKKRSTWGLSGSPPTGSALERAATTAKNWGVSMINRQSGSSRKSLSGFTSLAKEAGLEESSGGHEEVARSSSRNSDNADADKANTGKSPEKPSQPMGRGQPLPPAGTPLPGPKQSLWASSSLNLGTFKRKPVAGGNGNTAPEPTTDKPANGSRPTSQNRRRTSSLETSGTAQEMDTAQNRRSSVARKKVNRYVVADAPEDHDQEVMIVAAPPEDDDEAATAAPALPARPVAASGTHTLQTPPTDDAAETASPAPEERDLVPKSEPTANARRSSPDAEDEAQAGDEDGDEGSQTGTIDTATEDAPPPEQHHREQVRFHEQHGKQGGGWHTGPEVHGTGADGADEGA